MNKNRDEKRTLFAIKAILFWATFAWAPCASEARADLNQSYIRSIEWLVDNCDVIAVVRHSPDDVSDQPAVLRTLKGDTKKINWPLQLPRSDGYHYWSPWPKSSVRLIFVRGDSEVLLEVGIARKAIVGTYPKITDVFYGVTQYGNLLLTESDLFDAVENRIRIGFVKPISHNKSSPHASRSGIEAGHEFPLDTSNETYVLVVPFAVDRREHYIEVLQSGNAAERIYAIRALSQFDDEKAMQAIRGATKCDVATPAFHRSWSDSEIKILTSADVRMKAKSVLGVIAEESAKRN